MSTRTSLSTASFINQYSLRSDGGRKSSFWQSQLEMDEFLVEAKMCIEVSLSTGQTILAASDKLEVVSGESGRVYSFEPYLVSEPETLLEANLGEPSAVVRDIQFSLAREVVDVEKTMTQGAYLSGFGEVFLAVDGMDYDDRIILMRGFVSDLTYGDFDEPVTMKMSDPRQLMDFDFPNVYVDYDRFDSPPEDFIGKKYPLVYNYWHMTPCVRTNADAYTITTGTSETLKDAISATDTEIILSSTVIGWLGSKGHITINGEIMSYDSRENQIISSVSRCVLKGVNRGLHGTTAAAHSALDTVLHVHVQFKSEWVVTMNTNHLDNFNADTDLFTKDGKPYYKGLSDPRTGGIFSDNQGQQYIGVKFEQSSSLSDEFDLFDENGSSQTASEETRIKKLWTDSEGLFARIRTEERQTLSDILEDIVTNYTPGADSFVNTDHLHTALAASGRHFFPSVCASGSEQDTSSGAITFIEESILAQYPMLSAAFVDGKWSIVSMDARRSSVFSFTEGRYPCIERESSVTATPVDKGFSDLHIKYSWNQLDGSWGSSHLVDSTNNDYCAMYENVFGRKSAQTIESHFIYRETEVVEVGEWMSFHYCRPSYEIDYCFSPWALVNLNLGDTVTITDPDVYLDNAKAVVQKIAYQRGKCMVTLLVYPEIQGLGDGLAAPDA